MGCLMDGTGTVRALVQNCTFNANRDDGFQLLANADSNMDLTFNNNTVHAEGNPGAASAHSAINFDGNTTSNVRVSMTGGTVSSADPGIGGSAIIINPIGTSAATFDCTIDNVTIGTANVPGSGSATGQGFRVIPTQNVNAKIVIKNCHINGTSQFGMLLRHNDGSGNSDFTITGNTITAVGTGTTIFVRPVRWPPTRARFCVDIGGSTGNNTNPLGILCGSRCRRRHRHRLQAAERSSFAPQAAGLQSPGQH